MQGIPRLMFIHRPEFGDLLMLAALMWQTRYPWDRNDLREGVDWFL